MENHTSIKYMLIAEKIKKDIKEGIIKSGDQIPSENELCKIFGVSRHTVRKALSVLINEKYLSSVHGKGTFCTDNYNRSFPSNNIAVITTYISDYIFSNIIRGIDEVLSSQGYSIILKNTANNQSMETKCLEDILSKNIDGLIIEPSKSEIYNRNQLYYNKLDEMNIPYVFIQGIYSQMKDKPSVLLNDKQGGYLATRHLLELNHKNIIGIFKIDDYQGSERHNGYILALTEFGYFYDPTRVICYHTEDRKTKPTAAFRQMLDSGIKIDGIVCYNDQIALSVYKVLLEYNLSVPEDISIVGYDNSFIAENNAVKFTSIDHPKEEFGRLAAELLLKQIKSPTDKADIHKIIEPVLIVRDSCIKR